MLDALGALYIDKVRIPSADYSRRALSNSPKVWPYLDGCIGAIDGTYIPISIQEEEGQSPWAMSDGMDCAERARCL